MTLAEISIRRPVFTIVISLLITLFGIIGLNELGVREYPAVDPPTISITTSYPGAAAEVVQSQITEPIEEAVNGVAGIKTLTSTSREGASQINAEFALGTDLDTAASDVRDQLARAVRNLPPDANPPILNKANADSNPIFGIALSSPRRSQLELSAFADSLREKLQTVPGIGTILRLVLLYDIHDMARFPRVQDFASSCRLVKCAKASAGKRSGTSGTTIGNAHLTWACSEAAVFC